MSFKSASIKATKELIERKNTKDEVINFILPSFIGGFDGQNGDVISLYLDNDYIKLCKKELDFDLHSAMEKLMKT